MSDNEFNRLIADLVSIQILYISDDAPKTRAVIDKAIEELKRLSKYETTVRRIAWDYIELSHDKAYNQRDEYIRWCRATIQKDKDRHD